MIFDKELLGYGAVKDDGASENFAHYITVPIFTRIEQTIRKNLAKAGDSNWMVMCRIIQFIFKVREVLNDYMVLYLDRLDYW